MAKDLTETFLNSMSGPATPPIRLTLGKFVLKVELFDLVKNEQIQTFHREGKHCTFSTAILHGDFELSLRLDWGDLQEGEPMLDLDVVRITAEGIRNVLKPKQIPQHHTSLSGLPAGNDTPRTYDLKYQGLSLRIVAKKSFALTVGLDAFVVNPHENRL